MKSPKSAALVLLLMNLGLASQAQSQPQLQAEFEAGWVAATDVLRLALRSGTLPATRELRVFIGTRDVSPLLRWGGPGRLEILPAGAGWPAGETEFVLYGADWAEIARWPLRVLTASGLESSSLTGKLDLHADRRASAEVGPGQPQTRPSGSSTGGTQAGVAWTGARSGWQWQAGANLSGNSQRAKALRFAERPADAPKLDLADYKLAAAWGGYRAEVGHLSAGTQPLLAQEIASRGLGLSGRIGELADLSLHVVSGSPVVGWSHPLGVDDSEHRLQVLTLGAELLAHRPGGLRAELSLLDASVLPRAGFNVGAVADAEQSRGLGLRLLGQTEGGRLRGEVALARSRYTHPFDEQLALGGELKPVQPVTRNAFAAEVQAGLLQQMPLGGHALDLTLTLRHDRAAPLYRSLAAFVTSDLAQSRIGLQAGLAGASAQLMALTKVDNLARVATLLRTRTQEINAALGLPLAQWLGSAEAPAAAWPTLSWSMQQVHQRAANTPLAEDSGFAASQRPDQHNTTQQLKLDWALPGGTLGYGLSQSVQDNHQPGRETADFRQLAHQLSVDWAFSESLRASLSLTRSRQRSAETGLVNWTTGGSLGLDWQWSERWALSASASHNAAADSLDRARTRNDDLQAQLSWRFSIPGLDKPLPGQVYLRAARQTGRQVDSAFNQDTRLSSRWVDLGLSFSFF